MTFIAAASASTGASTATSLTINAPAGLASGHVMVAGIATRSDPATVTAPAGWTSLISRDHSASSLDTLIYYRVAGGSEPANYTWSFSASIKAAGAIGAWSGIDNATPIDASGSQENAASTSCTAPSISPVASAGHLVYFASGSQAATLTTAPSGMTERADVATSGGTDCFIALADQTYSASGATGERIGSLSTNPNNIGALIAIQDSGGGGGGGGGGTELYVDTVSGSNGNPGTLASPFLTVQYAVAQLTPGATLYIRGGASAGARRVITEQIAVSAAAGCQNGTVTAPIYVRNYAGEYVEFRPTTGGNYNWRLVDMDYWTLTSDISGSNHALAINRNDVYGFAVDIQSGSTYCVLSGWEIYGGAYDTLVRIDNSSYNTIQECRIYDNERGPNLDAHGVYIHSGSGGQSNYNLVYNNDIYNVAGHCVEIENAQGTYELGNIIRGNRMYAEAAWLDRSEAHVADKNGNGTIVEDNTIYGSRYHVGTVGGTSNNGRVIVQANQSINGTIRRNILRDFSGRAIVARPGAVIDHNLIYDFVYEAEIDERWAIYVENTGTCVIYNNTIVGAHPTGGGLIRVLGTVSSVNIRNNIFYDTGDINIAAGPAMTWGYNCWYLAAETVGGTGDVTSDPLFTNLAGDDYTLTVSSPCVNTGVVISGITDGYTGAAPDLGYAEYAGPSASASVSPSPSPSSSASRSQSPSASASASASRSRSPSASVSGSPSGSQSQSRSLSPSASPSSAPPAVVIVATGGTPPALRAIRLARGVRRLS